MSTSQFKSESLCTRGGVEVIGSPSARVYLETMPGVDGEFAQPHGISGRTIVVRGELTAAASTASAAHEALKVLIRSRQSLVGQFGAYVGTDGHQYDNCVLKGYNAGPIRIAAAAGGCAAIAAIEARIHHTTP